MLINNSDAIYLRNCAIKASAAHCNWQVTNEEINELTDRINLLEQIEDEPFITGLKPVNPDINAALHKLIVRRHKFAQEERSALVALKEKIFDIVPDGKAGEMRE